MNRVTTGGLVTALGLTLVAAPASASTFHRLAVHDGATICHGDVTEQTALLVNHARGERRFRVKTSTVNADGTTTEQDFRVTVDRHSDAEVSVFTGPGQVSKILVTRAGQVMYYRDGLAPICW